MSDTVETYPYISSRPAYILLLGQVAVSMLLCVAFLEISYVCKDALDYIQHSTGCTRNQSFEAYYSTSGIRAAIELVSDSPMELDIDNVWSLDRIKKTKPAIILAELLLKLY